MHTGVGANSGVTTDANCRRNITRDISTNRTMPLYIDVLSESLTLNTGLNRY